MFTKSIQRLFAKDDDAATGGTDDADDVLDDDVADVDTSTDDADDADTGTDDADDTSTDDADTDTDDADKPKPDTADTASRKENRVAKLARERNEERERRIRLEAQLEERSRAQAAPVNTDAARREREEKLALMDESERREFLNNEKIQAMEGQILLTQLRTEDMLDRNTYDTHALTNPVYAKHKAEVERRLSAERQAGRNWPRATLLAQIVGERALSAKPNAKEKEKARERVDSSKGKPVKGRSDATVYRPSRGNESLDDLENRLSNVHF